MSNRTHFYQLAGETVLQIAAVLTLFLNAKSGRLIVSDTIWKTLVIATVTQLPFSVDA